MWETCPPVSTKPPDSKEVSNTFRSRQEPISIRRFQIGSHLNRPARPSPACLGLRVQKYQIPLLELERRAIANALEYTKGDRAVAAHLLGIGRTTLYRKLKEYQLASYSPFLF